MHTRPSGRPTIIILVKRLTFLILLVTVLLAACGGQEAAPTVESTALPVGTASLPSTATAEPLPTETTAPPTDVPTEAPVDALVEEISAESPSTEPASLPEPTATNEPPEEVEEPAAAQVISGQTVEGAYFYGDPAAPLTLIDYSDFL